MSSVAAASSFADCFPGDPLPRFWQGPSYVSGNPNIITIWYIHSYAFAFDNSTQSLGLESISPMNGSALLARVPAGERSGLSESASLLTHASSELALAKEAEISSHALSSKAQSAVRDNFGMMNVPLTNVFFLAAFVQLDILMKVSDVSSFISLYPAQYSAALEHAASAHDSLQSAALSISRLAQAEYEFLSTAGAGSQNYSGAASPTFNYAESLLAPDGGFCANEAAAYRGTYDYFASSPQLPDFSEAGFPGRLNSLGGAGENSSVARALSLYMLLSEAKGRMLEEYSTAQLSAQGSSRALSSELSLLGSEKLELMGDAPANTSNGASLIVGSSYTGIYSGYLNAKEDSSRAQSLLSSSQASFSSKEADGWLSQAISESQSSAETSQAALASLRLVRSNAEAAVLSQRNSAQAAIEAAQGAAGESASSLASAQTLSSARSLLAQAEDAFASASTLPSFGARYAAYTDAARIAGNAISVSRSSQNASAKQEAEFALSGYSSLISAAKSDGLDVSYEQGVLSQYRALLGSSQSQDTILAVQEAALQERQSLLLRLHERFSYLEDGYASAMQLSSSASACNSSLLQQQARLSPYFPSGKLDAARAAGSMASIERSISSLSASAVAQTPSCLSSLLLKNAHLSETYSVPVLGRPTGYSACISTQNPSSLSSDGAVSFSIGTKVPLYSSDFSDGDAISDAYPSNGKTTITLPSAASGQAFSICFEKQDQPAQITSAEDYCSIATEEYAQASRSISFISSRALPSLAVSQPAPRLSYAARAKYGSQLFSLSSGSDEFTGEIGGVLSGKGELEISYSVRAPFAASFSARDYETLSSGGKQVSFTISLSAPALSCSSGSVSFTEPYSGIANLSVTPLSGEKISRASHSSASGSAQVSFSFTPLTEGKESSFAVSYAISDPQAALSEALAQAETLVLTYNRTKDVLALSEARVLASQGKTNEALAVLSQAGEDSQKLSYSTGDYLLYLQEKSASGVSLPSLLSAQSQLARSNSTFAAQFSSALFKYQQALSSASYEADSGSYQKAVASLRKAKGEVSSSLASLALSSLTSASEGYAQARKTSGASQGLLSSAESELSGAQAAYTSGDFTQAILHSSAAISLMAEATGATAANSAQLLSSAESLRASYASLRSDVEPMLANFSSQYSALSTQSRRQLPFTPAQAQSRLDEADKLLAASKKTALAPSDAFAQANSSYAKLSSLNASLSGALASLSSSAASSLSVAQAALAEVKSRASQADAQQIGEEVARAEDYLASAMYSDSLASSERAIKAANTALSGAASGGNPLQTAALALISLLFIGAAAYYFFFAGKRRAPPEEKKEVPKAE
ncbi:MAG: hypothetical protein WCY41_01120 [Candidatus Micrarchaeia archaeon]